MEFEAGSMEVFPGSAKEQGRSCNVSDVARIRVLHKFPQTQGPSNPVGQVKYDTMYVLGKELWVAKKNNWMGGNLHTVCQ